MIPTANVFERREMKYLITDRQRWQIDAGMRSLMAQDAHGESTICNLYFDTCDFRIIRRSLEKPVYKEKLRLRSYGPAPQGSDVFLELKKKCRQVVYKRRIALPEREALAFVLRGAPLSHPSQIGREIDYFRRFYLGIHPVMHISYERSAYFGKDDPGFRVTFDRRIRWRDEELTLDSPAYGRNLLEDDQVIMEIKTAHALPLWMVRILTDMNIRQTSFSKYGAAYLDQIMLQERQAGILCLNSSFPGSLTAARQPA